MKGITFNRGKRKYRADISVGGKQRNLGYFINKEDAVLRLENTKKAIEDGEDINTWLLANPNPKSFTSSQDQFEEEYSMFLDDEDREPSSKDGYHKKLDFCFSNFRILQKRYEKEVEGKTHVVKAGVYFDSSADLFRTKLIHFRYWKAHLGMIGKQITYCNWDMTEFQLRLALLRVFQRNIYLPKDLQPNSENYVEKWKEIKEGIDEIVQESIYEIPDRKPQIENKIIFNPAFNLSKKERQKISTEHTVEVKRNNMIKRLEEHFYIGISKKKLKRESKISIPTISKYWEYLNNINDGMEQV